MTGPRAKMWKTYALHGFTVMVVQQWNDPFGTPMVRIADARDEGRAEGMRMRQFPKFNWVKVATTQGVQLCLVESLRDVRDQIGRVFDADRQPDRGVENAYFLADVSRNAGVGHACGQAGERLGTAQAHRQLEDLQRVQEFECGGLATDNVERER